MFDQLMNFVFIMFCFAVLGLFVMPHLKIYQDATQTDLTEVENNTQSNQYVYEVKCPNCNESTRILCDVRISRASFKNECSNFQRKNSR